MTYAVYFECSSDDRIFQSIFFPACKLGGLTVLPRLARRQVSYEHPTPVWEVVVNNHYVDPQKAFSQDLSSSEYFVEELSQLHSISSYFLDTLADPGLDIVGSFPVHITDSNMLELMEAPTKVPSDVVVRIRDLRKSRDWDALPGRKSI